MQHINEKGLDLIKFWEGCRLEAYRDVGGVWTIGYGQTGPDVVEGLVIDQETADKMLLDALGSVEAAVSACIRTSPSSNQFSALVAFTYNVGIGNFKKSTLLNSVNKNQWESAAVNFLMWDRVHGTIIPGLSRRREAEAELFRTPD